MIRRLFMVKVRKTLITKVKEGRTKTYASKKKKLEGRSILSN